MKNDRPPVGTEMFCVIEHLYYDREKRTAPFLEYCVLSGKIKRYNELHRVEMVLVGPGPDKHIEMVSRNLKDIGTKVFYSAKDAALLAKRMTEDYERRWGWTGETLRRPWEHLLEGDGGEEKCAL